MEQSYKELKEMNVAHRVVKPYSFDIDIYT